MTTYFYQSAIVVYTPVDFNDPLHVQLHDLVINNAVPSRQATQLMKLSGFAPSVSLTNTPAWSSDLFVVDRDDTTGRRTLKA